MERICITDGSSRIIYNGRINELPLEESEILKKGGEIYAGLEFCAKRRDAVIALMVGEIISSAPFGKFLWSELPKKIAGYTKLNSEAFYCEVYEE